MDGPNRAWASDITCVWTRQGWMYLTVIIDLFSRKVVGWSLGERMKASLVCEALDAAVRLRRPAPGLVFHSPVRAA
ncbi:MAG TPA: DDE-type integrase/transposase/recombinase [Polyangiaceae bacterium]|nr:DDE-type integrase/transposase/recombinase [Polyangiaceae bacterium]